MIREDILGGIKAALTRGESIERSKITLENAGYKKEDIEEAIRVLHMQQPETMQIQKEQPIEVVVEPLFKEEKEELKPKIVSIKHQAQEDSDDSFLSRIQKPFEKSKEQKPVVQTVSKYESPKPSFTTKKITVIILIVVLVFLLGILFSLFLFKDSLVNFFNQLFG